MAQAVEIKPIAIFHTKLKQPFEAARQGAESFSEDIGEIRFESSRDFEAALDGIEGFSHLWVMFQFHHNENWSPKVLPPRGSKTKLGVFATRSPYRPNALGLSVVELVERKGLSLFVRKFDLLDQTPVFDVKPYLKTSDSFPEANMGWLHGIETQKFQIHVSELAEKQLKFVETHNLSELRSFLLQQLEYDPLNEKKKRVKILSPESAVIAYRTWRAKFRYQESTQEIWIENISTGYSALDLKDSKDTYQDKALHRQFIAEFA